MKFFASALIAAATIAVAAANHHQNWAHWNAQPQQWSWNSHQPMKWDMKWEPMKEEWNQQMKAHNWEWAQPMKAQNWEWQQPMKMEWTQPMKAQNWEWQQPNAWDGKSWDAKSWDSKSWDGKSWEAKAWDCQQPKTHWMAADKNWAHGMEGYKWGDDKHEWMHKPQMWKGEQKKFLGWPAVHDWSGANWAHQYMTPKVHMVHQPVANLGQTYSVVPLMFGGHGWGHHLPATWQWGKAK